MNPPSTYKSVDLYFLRSRELPLTFSRRSTPYQHWTVIVWCGALSPICNVRVWKTSLRLVLSAEESRPSLLETVVWDRWVGILHPLSPPHNASTTSTSHHTTSEEKTEKESYPSDCSESLAPPGMVEAAVSFPFSAAKRMPKGPWMPGGSRMRRGERVPRCSPMPWDLCMPWDP